ncbi:hypothetical protein, partial [Kineococcus sp. SYSU DK018]|uniref:hypothetical protein n=1 Tax=Kineococcus sp. SYSU DK018 TaxID=3383139 RepID=UPI003D7E2C9C
MADELSAAHAAGWWLSEPMRSGHLHAARLSRRRRARPTGDAPPDSSPAPPALDQQRAAGSWRLRLVDEAGVDGEEVFDPAAAPKAPLLAVTGDLAHDSGADGRPGLVQVAGPALEAGVLEEMTRQVSLAGQVARVRWWGVAPARIGPGFDLIAEGSALRAHAVHAGVLMRIQDAVSFQHAADGATDLARAAAAYRRLAVEVEAVIAAGGRLLSADDGLVLADYPRPSPRPSPRP